MVVADGLGGHAAGEVASALAVDTLVGYLAGERLNAGDRGEVEIERALIEAFEEADVKVRETVQSRKGRQGMGTTLIAACLRGDHLYTCHVGDAGRIRCGSGRRSWWIEPMKRAVRTITVVLYEHVAEERKYVHET